MLPSRRRRIWQLVPLLLCGVGVLALLPAGQPGINHVNAPSGAQTATAPAPAVKTGVEPASLTVAAPADNAAPAPVVTASAAPVATPAAAPAGPAGPDGALPSTAELSAPAPAAEPNLPDGLSDGKIGATAVNARSGPSVGNDKLFVVQPGEPIKIGESNGNWVHIYRQDGSDGWVFGRYIAGHEPPPQADTTASAPRENRVADTMDTRRTRIPDDPSGVDNLIGRYGEAHGLITARVGPSGSAPPSFLLQPGDRFRIAQSHGAWILIITEDGMEGWIAS